MHYIATKKVPGGKLLRIKLDADNISIGALQISGDFFLHPEETLPKIEEAIVGLPMAISAATLSQKIDETLAKEKAIFIGITADDIAATIIEALETEQTAQTEAGLKSAPA